MSPRDVVLTLFVMVIWGVNFAVAKYGLREFSPMLLMCLRFAMVAVMLVPFVRIPWGQMKGILVLSVLLGGLHFPLMFTGLTKVDAAAASIAIQLQVPFSSLLAALLYKDKLGWRRGLGMAISFAGVMVIAGEPRAMGGGFYLGLVVIAALIFSVVNIQIRRIGSISGFALNGWMAALAAPQLLIVSLLTETGQIEMIRSSTWVGWSSIAYMAILVTIVSYAIWYRLVRRYQVNQTMPWTLLVPVFGVLSGILMLGEPLTPAMMVGGTLTLMGVAVIMIRKVPKQNQNQSAT
ncbi:DMT transporter permease [Skermanella stibiiresistens SB22]|uniref:DMT transporter permease n=1 Tax=Skermanella stibiiresistens SB22 TaxID=1385369 RepID=W9GUD4_9PROT|nr:EamA family transporter [Skermanella stibiiresistens]EWY37515.1 DMT transporter permease [Skermanella stibiiresistens SB22]